MQPAWQNVPTNGVITAQPTNVQPITGQKDWENQLWDLPDFGTFALSCLCPWAVMASVAEDVGYSYSWCCFASLCTLATFQWPCHCLLGCIVRGRVRRTFNIRGNPCCDLCAYCCCYSCTLNQAALQVEYELARARGRQNTRGFSIRLGQRQFMVGAQKVDPPPMIPLVPTQQAIPVSTMSNPLSSPLLTPVQATLPTAPTEVGFTNGTVQAVSQNQTPSEDNSIPTLSVDS
ncbi:hypothetical protein CLF_104701 [Clonorchis sinensis]|uniref:Uncharacterized protein n=1 Tax=Clonorchis sinensis TaxID=79923 RepID=G7YC57_CLOSI|nr:hypothetical protein CLF_104701 [Clonorchis sinensis]